MVSSPDAPPDRADAVLGYLADAPLLAMGDLARLVGPGGPRVLGATGSSSVGNITLPTGDEPTAYYYLTDIGVDRVARARGETPLALTAAAGLGRRALQRRLIRIDHLTASRVALIDLALGVAARGGAAGWRPWPLAWRVPVGAAPARGPAPCVLDGEIDLAFPGGARRRAALLWDGGPAPPERLRARLAEIARLPLSAGLPPVLVVTADPWRLPDALPPAVLWCTTTEFGVAAPLDAPWRGARLPPGGLALPDALAGLGPYARRGGPGTVYAVAGAPPAAGEPLLPRGTAAPPHLTMPAVLAPGDWTVLAAVAAAPFITPGQLARAHGMAPAIVARGLAVAAAHGLLAPPAYGPGAEDAHHTASVAGVDLLARRAGLRAGRYGVLYRADAGDAPGGRLVALRQKLAHTRGVNDVYVYLVRGARAIGIPLSWYGEQRAWIRLGDGGDTFYLKPDARGTLGHRPRVSFFLEYDRGTARDDEDLRVKFAAYYALRRARGLARLHVLAVAPAGRVERLLDAARGAAPLAERVDGEWLDLRVATPGALVHGRLDSAIWRVSGRASPVPLLGSGGIAPLAPSPSSASRR